MEDLIEVRRKGFEAWHCERFKTERQTGQPTRDKHNGVYDDDYGPADEQERWLMWNAALDSIVVELPDPIEVHDTGDYQCDVIDALAAAGIKTKVMVPAKLAGGDK